MFLSAGKEERANGRKTRVRCRKCSSQGETQIYALVEFNRSALRFLCRCDFYCGTLTSSNGSLSCCYSSAQYLFPVICYMLIHTRGSELFDLFVLLAVT